jgi:hypothetical protein
MWQCSVKSQPFLLFLWWHRDLSVGPVLPTCLALLKLLLNKTCRRAAGLHADPWLCGTGKLNYDVPLPFRSTPCPRRKERKSWRTAQRGWVELGAVQCKSGFIIKPENMITPSDFKVSARHLYWCFRKYSNLMSYEDVSLYNVGWCWVYQILFW